MFTKSIIFLVQIKAIVDRDDQKSVILNDTMNWVEAALSKPLISHLEAGVFEPGDIVEISKSLGSPHDLHIVSLFFSI